MVCAAIKGSAEIKPPEMPFMSFLILSSLTTLAPTSTQSVGRV